MTDGYGIFNIRANVDVCSTHEWGVSQAQTSLHKSWLGGREKSAPHPVLPGDRTQGLRI